MNRFAVRGLQFAVVLAMLGCMKSAPPAANREPQTANSGPRVVFPDNAVIQIELATDDATREQGLMYRDQLASDQGMLFFFATSGNYPFWMKKTLIPLDMIWLDENRRIVAIKHNVPPCKADPCPSYDPNAIGKYVLEVASGVAARHALANGQTLRFEAVDNVIVR